MANPLVPFTVQDIMNSVYVNVDDDITSATTIDDEWNARLQLINMGIGAWERQDVYWRELWKNYTFPETISSATTYSVSATDFLMPGSLLFCTDSSGNVQILDIIFPQDVIKYVNNGGRAAYFTGNAASGWTLNLTWTPTQGDGIYGTTPSVYYYKSANRVSGPTDVPEMSDPTYLVWYVTYQKQLFYNRTDMAQDALTQSQESMMNMRIKNELNVNFGSNRIEDPEMWRDGDRLGL